ncbi:hypothetical protein DW651_19655 [Subdoligranulum sp. AM23-21AC]|uniref:hypothetical protein n=1 Tax=Ruthenibacterium lactatiformans TaxID=1550024 RepID=UPI000E3EF0DA|nr:hypothetical protein [Ruthenibacterium lactatiformans]RGD16406.1 hypothetical protein DW651_19655 [Subdoligranulum sp. AM23-21AC]
MAVEAGQLELNAFEPIIFFSLFQSVEMLAAAAAALTENCIRGITANEERCRELAYGGSGLATALCPYIGYKTAAEIAKESLHTNRSVKQVVLDAGMLDEKVLDAILDPFAMTGQIDTRVSKRSVR